MPAGPAIAESWFKRTTLLFGALLVFGPLATWGIALSNAQDGTRGGSTFFVQYGAHEPLFLALMAAFAIYAAGLARKQQSAGDIGDPLTAGAWTWKVLAVIALTVFGVTALGGPIVMHQFPLSMDEYVAEFQTRIFAAGRITVPVAPEWREFTGALRPVYVAADPAGQFWTSMYWPIYPAMRALFSIARVDSLLNPLFAAASVFLVYLCAQRLWPNDRSRAWIAAVFLASSSQFLFMSMTAYAMPAHLFFTLLWLYAYARGDRAGWIAAPIIGVVALGLHNPFPHALFVAPFLLHLLTQKRWGWTAYFAVVYAVGIAVWAAWMLAFQSPLVGPIPASRLFEWPGMPNVLTQGLSFSLLLTWQTPLLAILTIWSAASWRSLSNMERCLVAGVAVSLAFHTFIYTSQGHGWGYRYTYATLGSMALVGASAAGRMRDALGAALSRRLLVSSIAVTIVVQVPVRAWQIEHHVRPFAQLHDYVNHIDADVVIIDPTSSWYGIDLIRNDPFLQQKPKVLSAYFISPDVARSLARRGDRVHLLEPNEIAPFGIQTFPSRYKRPVWPPPPNILNPTATAAPGAHP